MTDRMTDAENVVPYTVKIVGEKRDTFWRECRLESGATVRVGFQPVRGNEPEAFVHRLRCPQSDGTTTELLFSLTREAVIALIHLYALNGYTLPACFDLKPVYTEPKEHNDNG